MHGFPDCDTVVGEGGHIGHAAVLHGCTVENGALIGMNATIMDGVTVGTHKASSPPMLSSKPDLQVPAAQSRSGRAR